MLNQIQNIISKIFDLRKGLVLLGLISVLVSGFVIGGGVRVEAEAIKGWRITRKETNNGGRADYCGDDRGTNKLEWIELFANGSTKITDEDNIMKKCVYASLGNNGTGGNQTIYGAFKNCEIFAGWEGRELFCKDSVRLNKDARVGAILPLSSLDSSFLSTDKMPVSHIKLSPKDCEGLGETEIGNKVRCVNSLSTKIGGFTCARNDQSLEIVICDNSIADLGSTGKEALVLYDKNNDISCEVEITKATDADAKGYVPGKVISCQKGQVAKLATIKNDPTLVQRCVATRSNFSGTGNNGQLICGNINQTVAFKDNPSYQYYYNYENSDNLFKSPGTDSKPDPNGSVSSLTLANINKLCEAENVPNDTKYDCKKKTVKEFFDQVVVEAKKGTAGITVGEEGTGTTSTSKPANGDQATKGGNPLEGIFTIIYQIVAAIIMALLFLVRYLQMTVLLLFISVMTVLLNLSPNTGFLTTLAVPLWSIFAQIASLGAVGLLIFYGSATMIGISGFEYQKTIEKGAKVAIYVFVSNFTYFGLAFAISLLDGFTKLIVFVFGGGSVFKLFEALIASVSSISKVGSGTSLIPDLDNIGKSVGAIFGMATNGGGAGNITTTLVKEIIVVIGLGLIIWVFGRIFFMLLTRVAILLLLLITSPIWVLGILVKDSLPSELQAQVTKAVSLVSGTVLFNFAFITTLVLVTIITQKINGGISDFQKSVADVFVPATNTGLAFIDGVSANAQSGVLSNDAFLGFGSGGFGETISVCAVLGINLAIIYFAFDAIANLIDTNIVNVGKAVGGAVSKNLQNFRKADSFGQGLAMMGQDAFKYGSMAATGGNGLIGDAAGAGLKGVSMTERGSRRFVKSVATNEGRKQWGKDISRTTGAGFQTIKDLGKLGNRDLSGLNIVGNLRKNLENTTQGNNARNRAEALDKEITEKLEANQKLKNDKSQVDDKLEETLNAVEDELTGAVQDQFKKLRADREINKQRMEQIDESVKAKRLALAKEMESEGKDINDPQYSSDQRVIDYNTYENAANTTKGRLGAEINRQNNDILSRSGARASQITNLEATSNSLKSTISNNKKALDPIIRRRDYERKEEGHEKLDILKQQAKALKDKSDYNAGGFSGILNNAEVITDRLNKIAKTDNPQDIENLRKTVSQLQKDGKLSEDQANQIEGNLTKGKSDQEKAVAQILEAIKASKTT